MDPALRRQIDSLPTSPGCYLFRDAESRLLYVGKASSLRSRVRSYFQPGARHAPRTEKLVARVARVETIVTDTEREALFLESNLIREHRPRFNVRLKDDKNFPYLRLSLKDTYPRVTLVRRVRRDGASYYGPWIPASVAWRTLRMVPRFFQVANCHLPFDGKQRPCLYYHLDQCLAPCAGKTDPQSYGRRVAEARLFLEGRDRELEATLRQRMTEASEAQDYERAAHYRDLIASIERLSERQNITTTGLQDGDYWAAHREGGRAMIQLFCMRGGRVRTRREFRLDHDEAGERFYDQVLPQYYADREPPREVYLAGEPCEPALLAELLSQRRGSGVRLRVPRRGVRRRFMEMASRNARMAFEERFRAPHTHGVAVVEGLREVLDLPSAPSRIECLDVSHHQGEEPYTSVVVFDGGRPRRAEYRLYRPRSAPGGDDYAALGEVAGRRYGRLAREDGRLPDLVLVDGGRGQLAAVRRALDGAGLADLHVASIAKKEEALFTEGGGDPIRLERNSPVLHLAQQLRDEAHRFALRHHRSAKGRRALRSTLTDIPGVGPVLARRLLRRFGSLEGVRAASPEELRDALGPKRAESVRRALVGAEEIPGPV
jgi:excinuclease ABC subunit C